MALPEASALFAQLDRELWLITAAADEQRGGLVATTVQSASIVPELPRVTVGLAKQHFTWELLERSGAFSLHLLDEPLLDWVWRFGLTSGRGHDKLAGLTWTRGDHGSPLLTDALASLECVVESKMDTGDRTVYLAEVVAARRMREGTPLTVRRLLQLAPPERMLQLKEQLQRDAGLDAAAIQAWRGQRKKADGQPVLVTDQ